MVFILASPLRANARRFLASPLATPGRLHPTFVRLCAAQPFPHPESESASSHPRPDSARVDDAVRLADRWAAASASADRGIAGALAGNEPAVNFVMKFTDWVMRPEDPAVAARLLRRLVAKDGVPAFLGPVDQMLMRVGVSVAQVMPAFVVGMARWRMREFVEGFVGTVEKMELKDVQSRNVNLLGEAVLGNLEANKRREEAIQLLGKEGVDYVSVKVSGVTSQLNKWDFDGSLRRVIESLRPLFEKAAASNPRVLINLDMEEYHDLELTIAAFTRLLEEPQFADLDAGIVLQTYLPDALPALQHLVSWAETRPGNGEIKIRLVKGANMAMEKVDATMHGWEQAPYGAKSETDANYLRCLNWALTPQRTKRVRIGVASHNLFLLAYAHVLAHERGVVDRVGFEMLQGMTPAHTPVLANEGHGMLLYTPICRQRDFDVAISYLFRRFEEASSEGNFLRSLPTLSSDSPAFQKEETQFRIAAEKQDAVSVGPRRSQERPAPASASTIKGLSASPVFINEPDTDPSLPENRAWALDVLDRKHFQPVSKDSIVDSVVEMDTVLERARRGMSEWNDGKSRAERKAILRRVADVLAQRRGDLINAMVFEGSKTFGEADGEVSEAIDFANYYGLMGEELPESFEPFGVVSVTAPWNFPVAISSGGIFSALAAGNAVIFKPSHATPRCGELVAECAWEAGIPKDALQFVRCPERAVGKHLVMQSDAVILTGASDTANMFRSWKNDIRLFAETSGKNSLVISPAADLDLAVADLVQSAFSNSGQKCSASSLAVCIGDVYHSERVRRQLADAVNSLKVADSSSVSTSVGPLIMPPEGKLLRALTELEEGEEWLVEPQCLDADGEGRLWTPGVRLGVKPGSWFHQTEVFGPVLGIMHAKDLDEALEIQNGTVYGLTGGLHSLDTQEIDHWVDKVEVGNAYVNRSTTGAIVRRQCFGGWKASVVGAGAKAGGPNYVMQFGTKADSSKRDEAWLARAARSDADEWESHFSQEHDPMALVVETNDFRYRPLEQIAVRIGPNADKFEAQRVRAAIERCGVSVAAWSEAATEDASAFADRLANLGVSRVRVIGKTEGELLSAAATANVHVADDPVVADGRIELQHYLREQSISRTRHRFGNLVTA